jgi:recombinational DNA repair ATPase RecF
VIRVHSFSLSSFRGYRVPRKFDLGDGRSLLLFGRNGYGKSCISDAFEFLTSANGTLERLGVKKGPTTSGRAPLSHISRIQEGAVILTYQSGVKPTTVERIVSDNNTGVPTELDEFVKSAVVPFVVRGPELRKFVYETPQQRYEQLAGFMNASRLTLLQKDLRELQKRLRADQAQAKSARRGLDVELRSGTGGKLKSWDEEKVLGWLNERLGVLNLVPAARLDASDSALSELRVLEANERSNISLRNAQSVLEEMFPHSNGGQSPIAAWRSEVVHARAALDSAAQEVPESALSDLVAAAKGYYEKPENAPERCPLCQTPYPEGFSHSREAVVHRIDALAKMLERFFEARQRWTEAQAAANERRDQWWLRCDSTLEACGVSTNERASVKAALDATLNDDTTGERLLDILQGIADALEQAATTRISSTGTYVDMLRQTDQMLDIGRRVGNLEGQMSRRDRYLEQVSKARRHVDETVHAFFTSTVDAISKRTVSFYGRAQRYAILPVGVSFQMFDADMNENRGVELLIDFGGETGQKPQAYLSDSQLNTLALALRLAIIRHFNIDLPFIVLDDVVTSFDAECRKTTAEALIEELDAMQMLVLTHDDMFWRELRDLTRPTQANWSVKRIVRFEADEGPSLADDNPDEQRVLDALATGEDAAGLVRGFWDEWLRLFARQVGARPIIPSASDPFKYAASDLFESILRATMKHGLKKRLGNDPGMERIVAQLQAMTIGNMAVHKSEPIDGTPSFGDLRALFDDMRLFRDLFVCCGRQRFEWDGEDPRCRKCHAILAVSEVAATPSGA